MRHVTSIHLLISVAALCSFGCGESELKPIEELVLEPESHPFTHEKVHIHSINPVTTSRH